MFTNFTKVWKISLLAFVFAACEKKEKEQTVSFEVADYKTNFPLPGVRIELYRCTEYDYVFGCRSTENFTTLNTGQDGKATTSLVNYSKANEGILFFKGGYFATKGNAGKTYLNKEGSVNIRVIPGTTNYASYQLVVFARNDKYSFQVLDPVGVPVSAVDMTIKAIDEQVNTFEWQIRDEAGFGPGIIIKRGEIPNITIPYTGRLTITF